MGMRMDWTMFRRRPSSSLVHVLGPDLRLDPEPLLLDWVGMGTMFGWGDSRLFLPLRLSSLGEEEGLMMCMGGG